MGSSPTTQGWRKETLYKTLVRGDGFGLGDVSLFGKSGMLFRVSKRGLPASISWTNSRPHTTTSHGSHCKGLGCVLGYDTSRSWNAPHFACLLVPLFLSIEDKNVILWVVSCWEGCQRTWALSLRASPKYKASHHWFGYWKKVERELWNSLNKEWNQPHIS